MKEATESLRASAHTPWVVVQVHHESVAVHSSIVRELVIQPEVTPVPRAASCIRGVMNWRGKIIPCIDLRLRLGMPAAEEELGELVGLITARAADHMAWMEELYRSVEEHRPFTLTTDPHACAFGKWYDNFHTNNLTVAALLKKMDAPHKAIHAIAVRVENLKAEGKYDQARRLVDSCRETTLARLLELFTKFEAEIHASRRPVAIIVNTCGTLAALAVDRVEAVEPIDPSSIQPFEERGIESSSTLVRSLAQRQKGAGLVGLLDESQFLDSASSHHMEEQAA